MIKYKIEKHENRIIPDVWYDSVLTSSVANDTFGLDNMGFAVSGTATLLLVIAWINWFVFWLFNVF